VTGLHSDGEHKPSPLASSAGILVRAPRRLTIARAGREKDMEVGGDRPPNVFAIIAMALGVWVLVYIAAANIWSWHTPHPEIMTESEHHQQVAALDAKEDARLPARKRAKVGKRRQHRTSLAARVFRPTI